MNCTTAYFCLAACVSASLAISGCGSNAVSPAAPSSTGLAPTLNLTGVWQVDYSQTISSSCRTYGPFTATTTFRLAQIGDSVSGTISEVEAGGIIKGDRTLTLRGDVTSFDTRKTVDSTLQVANDYSTITGTFRVSWIGVPRVDPCGGVNSGHVVSARRVPFNPSTSDFAGTWEGSFGVEDCSAVDTNPLVRAIYCSPVEKGKTGSFRLELVQRSSSVSGRLVLTNYAVPVSGVVVGNHLVLDGVYHSSSGLETLTISDWSTARDEFGRMTGTFDHFYESGFQQSRTTNSHNVLVGVAQKIEQPLTILP